jgi:phi LC3 family holin
MLRIFNKVTLTAIIGAVVALVYQVLGFFGVVPEIAESQVIQLVGVILNLLVLLGIITDPTTEGVGDSAQALGYNKPKARA